MKQFLKNNYKFILTLLSLILILNIRFPYYIDAPGGISDISKKIIINGYEAKGSFNLAYVREYKATTSTLLISLINKDFKVLKKEDVLLDTENDKSYELRDKILMDASISDAIYVAFTKANKEIKILNNKLVVTYISSESNTDLKVGDTITHVNGKPVSNKSEISNIISNSNIGDKISIKVINNSKKYDRYAYIVNSDGNKKIEVLISNIREYQTNPKINVKVDNNESGSSGGLITALSIYNSLVPEDITKGLTIVGTGTIDEDGNVGNIGGVEYKLKSAVKSKADLFIVPKDENYEEASKIKQDNNYKIDIIGVSTFDEAVEYLENVMR